MDKKSMKVLGILISKEFLEINKMQSIITSYGNVVKTRLGINHPVNNTNIKGLIILELFGDIIEMDSLERELKELKRIKIQSMDF